MEVIVNENRYFELKTYCLLLISINYYYIKIKSWYFKIAYCIFDNISIAFFSATGASWENGERHTRAEPQRGEPEE